MIEKEREREVSIHCLSLQASLSRGAEAEAVGQMFANRPVDAYAPDLE